MRTEKHGHSLKTLLRCYLDSSINRFQNFADTISILNPLRTNFFEKSITPVSRSSYKQAARGLGVMKQHFHFGSKLSLYS